MYCVKRIEAGVSLRSFKVRDRDTAELLCKQANNRTNEGKMNEIKILLYTPIEEETKVVNGIQHYEAEFLVTEFKGVVTSYIASFHNPFDAVRYCMLSSNYCYAFSPHDTNSFVIIFE